MWGSLSRREALGLGPRSHEEQVLLAGAGVWGEVSLRCPWELEAANRIWAAAGTLGADVLGVASRSPRGSSSPAAPHLLLPSLARYWPS